MPAPTYPRTNGLFYRARQRLLQANLNWETADLKIAIFNEAYVIDWTHQTLGQITANRLGVSTSLTGKVATSLGFAASNGVLFPAFYHPTDWILFYVIFEDVGADDSGKLIAHISDALELPYKPDGLDLVIIPDFLNQKGWFRP